MFTMILIILAAAFWLSMITLAIVMPVNVNILRITKPFICPPGATLEIKTVKSSQNRAGARGLIVLCCSAAGKKDVKGKALTVLWGIFFVIFLVACSVAVSLWWDQIYTILFG